MFKTHRTYELTTGVKNNSIAVICSDSSHIQVLYHETIVFEKRGNKTTLRSGGWDTISTRAVINRALECSGSDYRLERKRVKGVSTTMLFFGSTYCEPFEGNVTLELIYKRVAV